MFNWLAAYLCKNVSNRTKKQIAEHFNYKIEKIVDFLQKQNKIPQFKTAENILKYSNEKHIEIISINNEKYPQNLKELPDPPYCLFCLGNTELVNKNSIAFVGTRRVTSYGIKATKTLIAELSGCNINIVSGMAMGIDTISHFSAIQNNLSTIAVLGCGVDVIYPKINYKLYNQIIENGLILSEFPPKTNPLPYYFPIRNRIISGLSLGTVVVEAREKSGSMITARLALEQGKEVFCVPGRMFDNSSAATNNIIKKGEAKLITCAEDIISELIGVEFFKKSVTVLNLEPEGILFHLKDSPKTIDELEYLTGKDRISVIMEITNLELDGLLFKNATNQYSMR